MAAKKRSTAKKTKRAKRRRSKASALALFNEQHLVAVVNGLQDEVEANKFQRAKLTARIERLEKKCK